MGGVGGAWLHLTCASCPMDCPVNICIYVTNGMKHNMMLEKRFPDFAELTLQDHPDQVNNIKF